MYLSIDYPEELLENFIDDFDEFVSLFHKLGFSDGYQCSNVLQKPIIVNKNGKKFLLLRERQDVRFALELDENGKVKKPYKLMILTKEEVVPYKYLYYEGYFHDTVAKIDEVGVEIEIDGRCSTNSFAALTGEYPTEDSSIAYGGGEFKILGLDRIQRAYRIIEKYPRYRLRIRSTHIHTSYRNIYKNIVIAYMFDESPFDLISSILKSIPERKLVKFFGRNFNDYASNQLAYKSENRYAAITYPILMYDSYQKVKILRNIDEDYFDETEDEDQIIYTQPTIEFRLPKITTWNMFNQVYRWLKLVINTQYIHLVNKHINDLFKEKTAVSKMVSDLPYLLKIYTKELKVLRTNLLEHSEKIIKNIDSFIPFEIKVEFYDNNNTFKTTI